jgi:hypothetical protein
VRRSDLINQARVRFDDLIQPYLVSDEQFVFFANEAVIEASRRARIFTEPVADNLLLVEGQTRYALPGGTQAVRRAKVVDPLNPENLCCAMCPTTVQILDDEQCGWENHTGKPKSFYIEANQLMVYPTPDVDSVGLEIALTVVRSPVLGETLEIQERYQFGLIDWMLYRAYQIHDNDTEGQDRELKHLAYFEREYGQRSSAIDEIYQLRNNPGLPNDGTF